MTWNNRIFRHHTEVRPGKWVDHYSLHEAYYDETGKMDGWTEDPIAPSGDTPEQLIEHLEQMLNDAKRSKDDIIEYRTNEFEVPFP